MSRVIIHAGGHKTGTTSVQDFFSLNREALAAQGVVVPELDHHRGAHLLAAVWMPRFEVRHGVSADDARKLWRDLVGQVAGTDKTLFISSEVFSRVAPDRVDFADVAEFLRPVDEVEIVYAMRQQASFLQAIYLQVAKTNAAPPPLWKIIRQAFTSGAPTGVTLNHNLTFDRFLEGFAPEQIRFLDYDLLKKEPGRAVGWFLRHCGVSDNLDEYHLPPPSNVSPDPLAQLYAAQMTDVRPVKVAFVNLIRGVLDELHGPGTPTSVLKREEVARLKQVYDPLNAELNRRVSIRDPLFRPPIIGLGDDVVYRDEIGGGFWRKVALKLAAEGVFPDLLAVVEKQEREIRRVRPPLK